MNDHRIDQHIKKLTNIMAIPPSYMEYNRHLLSKFYNTYEKCRKAKENGTDPYPTPESDVTTDIADRVDNLLQINISKRLRELLQTSERPETAALKIAEEVALSKFTNYDNPEKALDKAVRVGLAVMTEGVTISPIQGISSVRIKQNSDGTKYAAVYFAGPIRSAGGTDSALTLIIADHVRKVLGLQKYQSTYNNEDEIGRTIEELRIYEREVGSFQYRVTDKAIRDTLEHIPVEINGIETDHIEIVTHREMSRIETDFVRGGALRVLNDGIIGKSHKLEKLVQELSIEGWHWLKDLKDERQSKNAGSGSHFEDVIAGRPILSLPEKFGGFRLRYGRSFNTGLNTVGVHPATSLILGFPIVVGTQIKVDIPGKAATIAFVDTLEGPIVLLNTGEVMQINNIETAKQLHNQISKILHMGDILISFGDFLENNAQLEPSGYTEEFWGVETKDIIQTLGKTTEEISSHTEINPKRLTQIIKNQVQPSFFEAIKISEYLNTPLHPKFLYYWDQLTTNEITLLKNSLVKSSVQIQFPNKPENKQILEKACISHRIQENNIIIEGEHAKALTKTLGLDSNKNTNGNWKDQFELLTHLSNLSIKNKNSRTVGVRVGRPEKAMLRKMNPPVHVLFPIGNYGGTSRDLVKASKLKIVDLELIHNKCSNCQIRTSSTKCPECLSSTNPVMSCPRCGYRVTPTEKTSACPKCNIECTIFSRTQYNLKDNLEKAMERVGFAPTKPLKGVKGLTSLTKTPEPFEKGLLRNKHDLSIYKDGTIRTDTTNTTLTHATAKILGIDINKLIELGYKEDIYGNPLSNTNQLFELFIQDIIIPIETAEILLKTTKFIDELLTKFYKSEKLHNIKTINDLIGELAVGLAPHTSIGIVGRIIGFTKSQACFAHPLWHSAKRRDCDGDSDAFLLLSDILLNFSYEYLPDQIGGMMDAPLLLQPIIIPKEVQRQAHNFDITDEYPLEFYHKTLEKTITTKGNIEIIKDRLDNDTPFLNFKFTINTNDIIFGPQRCSYTTIKDLPLKIDNQIKIASKISSIEPDFVVASVLRTHLIPDMVGNTRAYLTQGFRCKKCQNKIRRITINGICSKPNCGGDIIPNMFKNSVTKYLGISQKLAKEYNVGAYITNRIKMIDQEMHDTFPNIKPDERIKQQYLDKFFD